MATWYSGAINVVFLMGVGKSYQVRAKNQEIDLQKTTSYPPLHLHEHVLLEGGRLIDPCQGIPNRVVGPPSAKVLFVDDSSLTLHAARSTVAHKGQHKATHKESYRGIKK